jgi:hypothetical protein
MTVAVGFKLSTPVIAVGIIDDRKEQELVDPSVR